MRRAFFLDRDGVINENRSDYVKTPDEFVLLPDTAEAIRLINEAEWLVIVVTNQSMIGRGISTEENYVAITEKMLSTLATQGARIDDVYYCPNKPEDNASCRKPEPGMLLKAAADHDIDLSQSVMIGDMFSDMEAGRRAGTKRQELVSTTRSLLSAVRSILDPGSYDSE